MDLTIVGAVLMLAVWAGLVFFTDAPGYVHLLLTAGVFLLIRQIVVRDTPKGPAESSTNTAESTKSKS